MKEDFTKVKRYDCHIYHDSPTMEEYCDGAWVSYEDYERLLKSYQEIKWIYEGLY